MRNSGCILIGLRRWSSSLADRPVRVRFAPSPTGPMHIGGLRTALVNYMFARKHDGKFVLRIEDTDQTRCSETAFKEIFDSLAWSGIKVDEGPLNMDQYNIFVQSRRKSVYDDHAKLLLKGGHAYPCFCSAARLEVLRKEQRLRGEVVRYDNRCRDLSDAAIEKAIAQHSPYVLRFKLSPETDVLDDMVFGRVNFSTADTEGDPVILKSDGMPVYHLANVVDDHLMNISHVIRGSEWLTSVPKHLQLYRAFGWEPPKFAHLPLMLSSSGKKFSKRNQSDPLESGLVRDLHRLGYLPSSILTWILATGGLFQPPNNVDQSASTEDSFKVNFIHSKSVWQPDKFIEELIQSFEISSLNRHHAQVSYSLLQLCGRAHFDRLVNIFLNSENCADLSICSQVRDYLRTAGVVESSSCLNSGILSNDPELACVLHRLQNRVSCFHDLATRFRYIWQRPVFEDLNESSTFQELSSTFIAETLKHAIHELACLESSTGNEEAVLPIVSRITRSSSVSKATTMKLLRVCLTGSEIGMPVHELILTLSPKESVARIKLALNHYK